MGRVGELARTRADMAKQPESNQPSLSSSHDEGREDSGLRDILAVAAKIKDTPDAEPSAASEMNSEDSGLIVFSAGDFGGADEPEDDLLGSFSGGLGGLGSSTDLLSSPDLTPLGGEGSVRESTVGESERRPVEDSKRNPLAVVAVVLGLALITVGVVYLSGNDKQEVPEQAAHAEMSARDGDAAVGLAEPSEEPVEPIEAPAAVDSGAEGAEEAGLDGGEAAVEAAAEGGEAEAGLLAGADDAGDADDPMAQKANLLGGGTNPVAKAEKWEQGKTTTTKSSSGPAPEKDPIVEPEPKPEPEPEPEPKPKPSGSHDDEVDCLLNPDLAKCKTSGGSKSKDQEVLAPKLPESLSSTQLRDGFNKVKSKAKACGAKHGAEAGTKVKVHASIEGATGKVTSVKALGEHAGTELGKCVEGVVEGAVFEQFKKPAMGVDYSLIM
jgi:hypothetical protein